MGNSLLCHLSSAAWGLALFSVRTTQTSHSRLLHPPLLPLSASCLAAMQTVAMQTSLWTSAQRASTVRVQRQQPRRGLTVVRASQKAQVGAMARAGRPSTDGLGFAPALPPLHRRKTP